jgi:transposase-like protein
MTQKRRTFTAVEKAAAVREHLLDKIPVSQIADRMNVQPTMIHNWINMARKSAPAIFVMSRLSLRAISTPCNLNRRVR